MGEAGFWVATIPDFPGAFSQRKTKAEARANVRSAMRELLHARKLLASQVSPSEEPNQHFWKPE